MSNGLRHPVRAARKRVGSWVRRAQSVGRPFPIEIAASRAASRLARVAGDLPTPDACRRHASRVRDGVLASAGLSPMPARTDLRPIRGACRTFASHAVENVAFESFPGFFVTANLYRPSGVGTDAAAPLRPAVLVPHGHTRRSRGPARGRFSREHQLVCATLARAGAVVLAYDMVGWGESTQLPHGGARNVLGLQLWNSLRAVDFVAARSGVDARRIGIAGFSGGATQAFLAAAVDERVAATALVAQLSAHFFGGCACERGIAVAGGPAGRATNVEIAAAVAPRPLLLVSTGWDWSRNTPDVEFPFLQRVYATLGAEGAVENVHLPDEDHDYGVSKRRAVYRFVTGRLEFARSADGEPMDVVEDERSICDRSSLCVFGAERSRPAHALAGAAAVTAAFDALPRSG